MVVAFEITTEFCAIRADNCSVPRVLQEKANGENQGQITGPEWLLESRLVAQRNFESKCTQY